MESGHSSTVDAATAQLDELLARVARGERLTLMCGGHPVANLTPAAEARAEAGVLAAIARGREFRARLRRDGIRPLTLDEIIALRTVC